MRKPKLHENILFNFSSFLTHLSIPVFVVDEQGNFLACNQRWLDATGYQKETLSSISKMEISESNLSKKISQKNLKNLKVS